MRSVSEVGSLTQPNYKGLDMLRGKPGGGHGTPGAVKEAIGIVTRGPVASLPFIEALTGDTEVAADHCDGADLFVHEYPG